MLTERRRTVRKQYEALQQRRALQDTTNHHRGNTSLTDTPNPQPDAMAPILVLQNRFCPALHLDSTQKLQLQQQIQQVRVAPLSWRLFQDVTHHVTVSGPSMAVRMATTNTLTLFL